MTKRDFLDIHDHDEATLRGILKRAGELKAGLKAGKRPKLLEDVQLGMIFEKASTRTRVSFEVGISQLGGHAVVMTSQDSQLGRGETIEDTARVLSRYLDMIMIRTFKHDSLQKLAEYADVPVINGLTDASHPCQVMTDVFTFEEHVGEIKGRTIAWVGDCNNMTQSWIHAADAFGFQLQIAAPEELAFMEVSSPNVTITQDLEEAVRGADAVTTDTWVSMGDNDAERRKALLAPYQVTDAVMNLAAEHAIFLHCLPAHREEEATGSVMDGARSVIFDEAENRLHVQKAIMLWCLGK